MCPEHSWTSLRKRKCLHKMENGSSKQAQWWAPPPKRPRALVGPGFCQWQRPVRRECCRRKAVRANHFSPWMKGGDKEWVGSGEGGTVQWLFGRGHFCSMPTLDSGFRNLPPAFYWDGCFVIWRILNPCPEDQGEGDAWAGFKVMYALSSRKYNWKFCHAESCM